MSTPPLLHYARVQAEGASPDRWILVLHGILGSGGNFRSIARALCAARPAWGALLVDLREHGQSPPMPGPSTLASAAGDVLSLERALGLPIRGVMGHSFGGKVTLAYLQQRAAAGLAPLDRAFILDASPSARDASAETDETFRVLRMLEAMPEPLASRQRFAEIVRASGFSQALADWLAMNVRRADDGFRLRNDRAAIRALLTDYYATDLWRVLDEGLGAEAFEIVLGGRSHVVDEADRARLDALSARSERVAVHVLERAGHWVHADDPEGLLRVVEACL